MNIILQKIHSPKPAITLLVFMLSTSLIFAQTIERQVIASTGGYTQQSSISASFTAGETVIKTASNGTIFLTQGFQQSNNQNVNIEDVTNNIKLVAYPNPTLDKVTLVVYEANTSLLDVQIYNTSGQIITLPFTVATLNASNTYQFDFSALAAATYFIVITDSKKSFSKSIQINKTN